MGTPSTALVVGGTSGIGLATARQLLARGAEVHVAGRTSERIAALAVSDPDLHTHQADGADTKRSPRWPAAWLRWTR